MVAFKDRTGEKFVNKKELGGYEFIIVKYNNANDLFVQFQDKYKAIVPNNYGNCVKGQVKNPYHPSVYGVACLGLMKDGSKIITSINGKQTREYILWHSMIIRCYDNKHSTYKEATVCDRWLVFANFLEDLPLIEGYQFWLEHPNEQIALDKDIKGNGSKLYCLDNCCFVSKSNNSKEVCQRCGNSFNKEEVKVYGINIKTGERTKDFDSIKEASRELGLHHPNIIKCLNGEYKTSGGYKWFKIEK